MTFKQAQLSSGFAPIAAAGAKVLILGSLPSQKSLQQQEYYAHPRNAFWPIMCELFDADPDDPYADRAGRLMANCIAVWDVLRSSVRRGSLDSSIVDASSIVNDFKGLFDTYPDIHTIAFNGRKAEQVYRRQAFPVLPDRDRYRYLSLPSTSPAHAAMSFRAKLRQWQAVKNAAME